jgi:3-oxoacyl-(acyl-carrier-protein) synthase
MLRRFRIKEGKAAALLVVPPAVNFREPDPECKVDVVANDARQVPVSCGVSTSFAFGGSDAALVMRRPN